MHDFGVYIRLEMMIFMISRVKQSKWKVFFFFFLIMEQDLESFGVVIGE